MENGFTLTRSELAMVEAIVGIPCLPGLEELRAGLFTPSAEDRDSLVRKGLLTGAAGQYRLVSAVGNLMLSLAEGDVRVTGTALFPEERALRTCLYLTGGRLVTAVWYAADRITFRVWENFRDGFGLIVSAFGDPGAFSAAAQLSAALLTENLDVHRAILYSAQTNDRQPAFAAVFRLLNGEDERSYVFLACADGTLMGAQAEDGALAFEEKTLGSLLEAFSRDVFEAHAAQFDPEEDPGDGEPENGEQPG